MARKRITFAEEDSTSQAGWLFADSFLALMVIFLATISFVPSISGGGTLGNAKVGQIAGTNYVDGLVLAYEIMDPVRIQSDLSKFLKEKKLPPATKAIYAKIIGGYSQGGNSSDGQTKAIAFAIELRNAGLEAFSQTKIDIGSSNLIPEKTIVLRLTLSPTIN